MNRFFIALGAAVIVVVLTTAVGPVGLPGPDFSVFAQAAVGSAPTVTEELIVEKDPGAPVDDEEDIVSADGSRAAWRTTKGGKWAVMLNGERQAGDFDEARSLTFSGDGRHLAFAARRDKAWVMVLDGKEPAQKFDKISEPLFSPDGLRLLYFGRLKGKWSVFLDGQPVGAPFDDLLYAAFGQSGQRLAYVGSRGGKSFVVADLEEGPPFDVIAGLQFSLDGRRLSYGGSDIKGTFGSDKGLGRVVIDGQPGPQFEGEKAASFMQTLGASPVRLVPGYFDDLTCRVHGVAVPVFSDDGSRVAYAAHRAKDNEVVIVNGEPGPQFQAIVAGPRFSLDGKRLAYGARRAKDDEVIIVDGQAGPRFSAITGGPSFSRDGQHVAYLASDAGGKFLVVDGERVGKPLLPGADFIGDLTFAPDGRRVGYVAAAGSFWAAYARNLATGISSSAKAIGRSAKRRVYVDGQPGPEYQSYNLTGPEFSSDSRHVLYVVHGLQDGSRRVSFVVTNHKEVKRYDAVWTRTLVVRDAGTVSYVAEAGRKFFRVSHSLQ